MIFHSVSDYISVTKCLQFVGITIVYIYPCTHNTYSIKQDLSAVEIRRKGKGGTNFDFLSA